MLKLKLQYFGHLMQRVGSLEKSLMLGEIRGRRRRGWQRMRWLDGITNLMDMSLGELQDLLLDREAWHAEIHGVTKGQTWLSDWTELKIFWEGLCLTLCKLNITIKLQKNMPKVTWVSSLRITKITKIRYVMCLDFNSFLPYFYYLPGKIGLWSYYQFWFFLSSGIIIRLVSTYHLVLMTVNQ